MDYVTVDGVKLRTGYTDKRDWYFLCLKELLDNAVDFLWDNYQGADDTAIKVYIEITSDFLLRITVRNRNSKNIAISAFEDLASTILDYNKRSGSKQNLHIISCGILGDALKQILALGYVLIHTNDDDTSFTSRQWPHPLIIRCNNRERQIFLHVDKSNQIIQAKVEENTAAKVISTDTEMEITLPIIDEVKVYRREGDKIIEPINISTLERFCKEYPIFTTDISFRFKLVDNSPDKDNPSVNNPSTTGGKGFAADFKQILEAPARKAAKENKV
jgi:virulence-associated protein VagC